jgi:hypothetical protein
MAAYFEIVISIFLGLFTSFLFLGDMSGAISGAIFWILAFLLLRISKRDKA